MRKKTVFILVVCLVLGIILWVVSRQTAKPLTGKEKADEVITIIKELDR